MPPPYLACHLSSFISHVSFASHRQIACSPISFQVPRASRFKRAGKLAIYTSSEDYCIQQQIIRRQKIYSRKAAEARGRTRYWLMVSRSMVVKEYTRGSMDKIKSDGEVLLAGDEEDEDVVLPGFRFHPTDEELVTFYLRRKVARKSLSIEIIREMDIYKHDPWDLPKASTVGGEKEWYFFCLRGRKYRNSIRPNRVTGSGFWKATGIDRPIYSAAAANSGESIGLKKSLVYYRGSAGKGTKTDWMMHEFRLPPAAATNTTPNMQEAEVWTICRIFKRNITYKNQQRQVWRPPPPADSSSNTGSFESDGGDEYMNHLAPAAAVPRLPQQQQHVVGQVGVVNGTRFFKESLHGQQFQGQWSSLPAPPAPAPEQKPQNPPPMTIAFHRNDHSFAAAAAANDFYKDGYWDEIARMLEITDCPAALYDCRYA